MYAPGLGTTSFSIHVLYNTGEGAEVYTNGRSVYICMCGAVGYGASENVTTELVNNLTELRLNQMYLICSKGDQMNFIFKEKSPGSRASS